MRIINIIVAFAVFICNIIVSYNHSIDLFHSGGFAGWMAHVAVIGCELTFILGALNIVVSRMKGDSPGFPALAGGLLGVALVSWSNVAAGWSYGITGILLGLATPVSLVIAEAILSRALLGGVSEQSPEKVAKKYFKKKGVLPTREKLMQLTKCKEWAARKVLGKMKTQVG